MVRPAHFGFNPETAESNAFQVKSEHGDVKQIAREEFDKMVNVLTEAGVNVIVVEDTPEPVKPDAVFPNNWISFHSDGTVFLYPMQANSRRKERRLDLIENLSKSFKVRKNVNLSEFEEASLFLEGTGSMVFDRKNKIIYACVSPRTHEELIDLMSDWLNYEKVVFTSVDESDQEIYHTNVMMALGQTFVVICLDSISNPVHKNRLLEKFKETGKEVIEISYEQMNKFAGNMLGAKDGNGNQIIIMSSQAYNSLSETQRETLRRHGQIVHSPIDTIEKLGGGSARCMMAEVFLPSDES